MAKQVDLSPSQKVKLVPELVTRCDPRVRNEEIVFLHHRCHVRLSKKDVFILDFESEGNRSQEESEKARRRI